MAKKRTVMHSKSGKKLYAVRDEKGEFTDIQSYQKAQAADMRQTSQAEMEKKSKKKAVAMKSAPKKAKPAKKKARK